MVYGNPDLSRRELGGARDYTATRRKKGNGTFRGMRRWVGILAPAVVAIVVFSADAVVASQGALNAADRSRLVNALVDVAAKLYHLESSVPELYAKAFRADEAGEGLANELFNDGIAILKRAIALDGESARARLYLAKSYYAKSSLGQGFWSRELLVNAKANYDWILIAAGRRGVGAQLVHDARRDLGEIDRLLQGMGTLK